MNGHLSTDSKMRHGSRPQSNLATETKYDGLVWISWWHQIPVMQLWCSWIASAAWNSTIAPSSLHMASAVALFITSSFSSVSPFPATVSQQLGLFCSPGGTNFTCIIVSCTGFRACVTFSGKPLLCLCMFGVVISVYYQYTLDELLVPRSAIYR